MSVVATAELVDSNNFHALQAYNFNSCKELKAHKDL